MSSDESLRRIEEELRSSELGKLLDSSYESFEAAKTGSGWDPTKVQQEAVLAFKPISGDIAEQTANARKTDLFTMFGIFGRPKPDDVKLKEKTLWYYPYWMIEGTHELFYFRPAKYEVPVSDDVVGVMVNGRNLDLSSAGKAPSKFSLGGIVGKKDSGKHFTLSDVTEFASFVKNTKLYYDYQGNEDEEIGKLFERNPAVVAANNPEDLKVRGTKTNVSESVLTRDQVVRRFQEKAAYKPQTPGKVWRNDLMIKKLQICYRPIYSFSYQAKDKIQEMRVDGVTGERL